MFSSNILDIAVTLGFTYLLLALIVSTVTEIFNTVMQRRSIYLRQGLKALFDNVDSNKNKAESNPVFEYVMESPFIKILTREPPRTVGWLVKWGILKIDDAKFPSYISPNALALAVIDKMKLEDFDYDSIKKRIESLSLTVKKEETKKENEIKVDEPENKNKEDNLSKIKDLLKTILDNSVTKDKILLLNNFTKGIEKTFNDCMDRASGIYKRKSQWITFIISFIVVLLINVDTLRIVKSLQTNKDMLQNAVTIATSTYSQFDPKRYNDSLNSGATEGEMTSLEVKGGDESDVLLTINKNKNDIDVIMNKLKETNIPIGWDSKPKWNDISNIIGWLISIIAIYLGAPFWFDVLNKVTNLRGAGTKPVETKSDGDKGEEKK